MQVWESDATEYLAFGSDAGAMEREPSGRTRSRGRERGVGLMMRSWENVCSRGSGREGYATMERGFVGCCDRRVAVHTRTRRTSCVLQASQASNKAHHSWVLSSTGCDRKEEALLIEAIHTKTGSTW